MALFASAPCSICILRLSAIGDVCNTIAVVQAIQKEWPSTKITWITGQLEAQLICDLAGIEVIVFDKSLGEQGYRQLWGQLKGRYFDALLHIQYALRASVATLGIRAKYKLGFDSKRSQEFQRLFTNIKVPSPDKPHILDGLFAFCHVLGIEGITPSWDIRYSNEDREWAQKILSKNHSAMPSLTFESLTHSTCVVQPKQHCLVVVPAASKTYKNWTVLGYSRVIEHALSLGWRVVLAGSSADVEVQLAKEIELKLSEMGLNAKVDNRVGQSSLKQMLALLDLADLVIAPDTGPVHMANAMNTPVIGLYAHHNPDRTGPYRYRNYVVSAYDEAIKAETGKEIPQLGWRTRVKDKRAMERIKADDVIAMFDKVVKDLSL